MAKPATRSFAASTCGKPVLGEPRTQYNIRAQGTPFGSLIALRRIVDALQGSRSKQRNRERILEDPRRCVKQLMCGPHVCGIHGVIWEYITSDPWQTLSDHPLTLASYCARTPIMAYVEPISVGCTLPDMPLFLTPDHYIYVPLEDTYMAAWRGVPQRWRRVIELQNDGSDTYGAFQE